ncbi:TonB-dependent siderophore receptor [Gallaecimonas mangrovi]|uniref:TonB-dependent siderophore receptor n=1 Tax=Gallaecimonas mangrovi TaxID=2291597 RepID=UPI000E20BE9C|nr:TonB-dependent siderophore receptor [Gallaecimonas mangrovi]
MTFRYCPVALAVSALLAAPTWADDNGNSKVERIEVVGAKHQNQSSATGLNLSARETPQSLTFIDSELMRDYNLDTINDVLEYTPGVTVEKVETDRTYYTSRGFEINNFQVDGIGSPFYTDAVSGDIDMSMYQRVEVVRGASGLMAGVGNPAATVNLVRKRPTADTQGYVTASYGRWNNYRLDADVSGSLTDRMRGRVTGSYQDTDSYLDNYSKKLSSLYGVVEGDLGDRTLLTVGVSHQESLPESPMWGALPLAYSNGTGTHFDRSTNTSADWAYWNTRTTQAFAELKHQFTNGWQGKLVYDYRRNKQDGDLFYTYGSIDADTNSGLTGYGSRYTLSSKAQQVDASITGSYALFGRSHELTFGADWAHHNLSDLSLYDYSTGYGFPAIGDLTQWTGDTPKPTFSDDPTGSSLKDTQKSVYAATRLHLTEHFFAIAGGRLISYDSSGVSYNVDRSSKKDGKLVPYGGLVYDLNETFSLYTSYAETFTAQYQEKEDGSRLSPTTGKTYEGGVKAAFNGLNASVAIFKNEYNNLAESVGYNTTKGAYYYEGMDYQSKGFEAQLSGNISDQVTVLVGYNHQNVEDEDGSDARKYVPRQTLKALVSYSPDFFDGFKVGAKARWQSATYTDISSTVTVKQGGYGLYGLFAQYQFTPSISGKINLDNITDKTYWNSLMWGSSSGQGFYGTPRSYSASISWHF